MVLTVEDTLQLLSDDGGGMLKGLDFGILKPLLLAFYPLDTPSHQDALGNDDIMDRWLCCTCHCSIIHGVNKSL